MNEPIKTEDSIGKALMLTATERMTEALTLLADMEAWSWLDAENFITVGVWHEPTQERLFELLREGRKDPAVHTPADIPELNKELRKAVSASFHVADHIGGISGLGSMVFKPDGQQRTWRIYAKSILTANFEEGNFGRISGHPGSGKTSCGCSIIEEWVKDPNHIALTNIRPKTPDGKYPNPHIIYVKDAREFFIGVSRLMPGEKFLLVLDEGGLIYSRPDAATRRAKDLDKLMRVIRHLHGSIIIIEQRPESVPVILQEFSTSIFYCHAPGIVSIELRGPRLAFRDKVKDFPKSELPFDTYDIAYWSVNVNVQALFAAVSGAEDANNAMADFMEAYGNPKARIKNCLNCGKSLEGMHPRAKYCSNGCRQAAYEAKKRGEGEHLPDDMQEFMEQGEP